MAASRSRSTFMSESRTAALPVVTAADLIAATRSLVVPVLIALDDVWRELFRDFRCFAMLDLRLDPLRERRVVVVESKPRDGLNAALKVQAIANPRRQTWRA